MPDNHRKTFDQITLSGMSNSIHSILIIFIISITVFNYLICVAGEEYVTISLDEVFTTVLLCFLFMPTLGDNSIVHLNDAGR